MSLLRRILARVAGNRFSQRVLERNVEVSQYLMGIGSAGDVAASGERVALDRMARTLAAPYCVFDVGSNRGQFLRLVRAALRPGEFTVHCFEPGRDAFGLLRSAAGGDARVLLNNVALGREPGSAELYSDKPGSELASLTKRRLDHFGLRFDRSEPVAVDAIDDYCSRNAIPRIHLLKMDIEGHELDALNGARQMFDRRDIDIVTFEFGGANIDSRSFFQDFWYFFEAVQMQLHRITPAGVLFPVSRYRESLEQFRTTAFVALQRP